jgi:hypothetical protein
MLGEVPRGLTVAQKCFTAPDIHFSRSSLVSVSSGVFFLKSFLSITPSAMKAGMMIFFAPQNKPQHKC